MQQEFSDELLAHKTVSVRVIPTAKKNEIMGKMEDGTWKIRIVAPAQDGKANATLLRFLKKNIGARIEILHGEKDRYKVLRIIEI